MRNTVLQKQLFIITLTVLIPWYSGISHPFLPSLYLRYQILPAAFIMLFVAFECIMFTWRNSPKIALLQLRESCCDLDERRNEVKGELHAFRVVSVMLSLYGGSSASPKQFCWKFVISKLTSHLTSVAISFAMKRRFGELWKENAASCTKKVECFH